MLTVTLMLTQSVRRVTLMMTLSVFKMTLMVMSVLTIMLMTVSSVFKMMLTVMSVLTIVMKSTRVRWREEQLFYAIVNFKYCVLKNSQVLTLYCYLRSQKCSLHIYLQDSTTQRRETVNLIDFLCSTSAKSTAAILDLEKIPRRPTRNSVNFTPEF